MIEIGRNKEDVAHRLEKLSNKDKITAVCIDMWRQYLDKVEYYLKLYPELEKAYFLHQELYEFYHMRDYEQALQYIANWSEEVLNSEIKELISVLKSIGNWLPYIMNKFIHRISNGRTEGKSNLIRAIRRQGFHYGSVMLRARIYAYDERKIKKL